MSGFEYSKKNTFPFTVEKEAFEGVKRIAKKVAADFEKVCGVCPQITEELPKDGIAIIFATLGKSALVDKLASENKIDISPIREKREVFQIKLIDSPFNAPFNGPFNGISKALLICGSDKRGTIYGMFALSEFIGVSPLHFWGDAEPARRDKIEITANIETVSKEPSVKYRGFFINDEWPCFGNWTFSHYGGFTAEMYDNVFELLLRLKGNFLWPAMWTSSFDVDGAAGSNAKNPSLLNGELADIYGVVVGSSHHEPMLRAGEEYKHNRGKDSPYGDAWNYFTNKEGINKFWEDGIKRSSHLEKLVTIGMRGEADSTILGETATVEDNINLLKDVITNQKRILKEHAKRDNELVLAVYKEVEEYFWGSNTVEGLKNWEGLKDVILMLCEDNYGFTRALPTEEMRADKSKRFGMYYHFDYHGAPISYEWMPSTSFERTWEQMCKAYDFGIKDIWIVNVGDLKFNEVSLAYFLELAYDFEKWGTSAANNSRNSIDSYTSLWLEKTFPLAETSVREKILRVLHNYTRMNAARRPEALNSDIYHPCHYLEADRMLNLAAGIEKENEEVFSALSENEKDAYYSMIYFPAKVSVNLLRMHLYAGKNRHFAEQGKKFANKYAALVTECIEKDRALHKEFALFKNGKWKGMELEQHIGFVKWNDDNYRYPLRLQVEPAHKPRLAISRKDSEDVYSKTYGPPMTVLVDDFLFAGNEEVIIEIANDGTGSLDYTVELPEDCDWLKISSLKGTVESQEEIILRCDRQKLGDEAKNTRFLIKDEETTVAVEVKAKNVDTQKLPPMTFLQNRGVIAIEANHFCAKKDVSGGSFTELKNYGRSGAAMKVMPSTADFGENDEKPTLSYRFYIEENGNYTAEIWTTPTNPVQNKHPLRFALEAQGRQQIITAVAADFNAGSPGDPRWCKGVLDQIRVCQISLTFEKGVCEISIGAMEAGLVLERLLIYADGKAPPKSYLGPR